MTTTSPATRGGIRVGVQRFGTFLSGMIMPNIPALIAWGIITAFFIPAGWTPNAQLAELVGPMIHYLLPIVIAYTGGTLVYKVRGGVVAAIAVMGAIAGSDYLIAQGETVFHIMGEGRFEEAHLTSGAEPQPDGTVIYPAAGEPVDNTGS